MLSPESAAAENMRTDPARGGAATAAAPPRRALHLADQVDEEALRFTIFSLSRKAIRFLPSMTRQLNSTRNSLKHIWSAGFFINSWNAKMTQGRIFTVFL
jgi:hypothetical protein